MMIEIGKRWATYSLTCAEEIPHRLHRHHDIRTTSILVYQIRSDQPNLSTLTNHLYHLHRRLESFDLGVDYHVFYILTYSQQSFASLLNPFPSSTLSTTDNVRPKPLHLPISPRRLREPPTSPNVRRKTPLEKKNKKKRTFSKPKAKPPTNQRPRTNRPQRQIPHQPFSPQNAKIPRLHLLRPPHNQRPPRRLRHPHLLPADLPRPSPIRPRTARTRPARVPRTAHLSSDGEARGPAPDRDVRGECALTGAIRGVCGVVGDLEGPVERAGASEYGG